MQLSRQPHGAPWRTLRFISVAIGLLCSKPVLAQMTVSPPSNQEPQLTVEMLDQMSWLPGGIGPLPAVEAPPSNPQSKAKIELGRLLFFDKRLSLDSAQSCASCHDPQKGLADGRPRAVGFGGKELGRHSPSVLNAAYNSSQFWDGRADSLEQQAEGPMLAAAEMNMTKAEVERRLQDAPEYRRQFQSVFGAQPTLGSAAKAIASFERTLVTPDSPFDNYARGDKRALSDGEKRGLALFAGKAACVLCHKGVNLTDNRFHKLGFPKTAQATEDAGRFTVTGDEEDRGAFKTPTLRNVALTAPYMHDGSVSTLEEVVDFYDRGGKSVKNKSALIFELGLSSQEKRDLVAFLKALTGKLPDLKAPRESPRRAAEEQGSAAR